MRSPFLLRYMLVLALALLMQTASELLAICGELPLNPPGCADTSSAPPCLSQGGTTSDGFCNTSTGDCEENPQRAPGLPSWAHAFLAIAITTSMPLVRLRRLKRPAV